MATVNHKKAISCEQVTAFRGIDASSPIGGGEVACDIKNFRVLSDGSLRKRSGYRTLATLPSSVRGAWVARDEEGDFILAVAGRTFYRISVEDGSLLSSELLGTETGEVLFFENGGEIYLMDGAELYHYRGGAEAVATYGYVPLYGKDWDAHADVNPVNEPLNLFGGKIRIEYAEGESTSYLPVGLPIQSVDKAFRDGKEMDISKFTITASGDKLALGGKQVLPLTLYVTVDPSYWHDAVLRSAKQTAAFDGPESSRVLFFGCEDPGRLYVSRPVTDEAVAAAQVGASDATGLYVPKESVMRFGDRTVTAAHRWGSRLMICTPEQVWLTEELEPWPALPLSLRLFSRFPGCCEAGGTAAVEGGKPVTLARDGIFLWDIETDPADGFLLTRISLPIEPLLEKNGLAAARLLYLPAEDELWVYRTGDTEGRVWIYRCGDGVWSSYAGITATHIMENDGTVCFISGADVCVFEDTLDVDLCSFGEREIVGVYRGPLMPFGDAEACKRAVRVYLEADAGEGEIAVGLSEHGLLDEHVFRSRGEGVARYDAAVRRSRFTRLAVTLRATGKTPQRIFGYCVHATGRQF